MVAGAHKSHDILYELNLLRQLPKGKAKNCALWSRNIYVQQTNRTYFRKAKMAVFSIVSSAAGRAQYQHLSIICTAMAEVETVRVCNVCSLKYRRHFVAFQTAGFHSVLCIENHFLTLWDLTFSSASFD